MLYVPRGREVSTDMSDVWCTWREARTTPVDGFCPPPCGAGDHELYIDEDEALESAVRETWTYEIQQHDRCGNDWCAHMDMIVTTAPADWTALKVAVEYAHHAARILCSWDFRVCVWRGDMREGGYRKPDAIALGEELLNAAADRVLALRSADDLERAR